MNPPSSKKRIPLGPTGEVVRENFARLRGAMQYKELSERLAKAGRPIPPLGLRRIEAGERRVDADDLMALAMVFGVAPNALLLPHFDDDSEIEVTGGSRPYLVWGLWNWANGNGPIEAGPEAEARYWMGSKPVSAPDPEQPYIDAVNDYFDRVVQARGTEAGTIRQIKQAIGEVVSEFPENADVLARAAAVRNLPVPPPETLS